MADNLHEQALFELVWHLMREHKINTITVSFDGSGDSGEIHDISPDFMRTVLPAGADANMHYANQLARWEAITVDLPKPEHPTEMHRKTLHNLVHELSDDILSYSEAPDWVNNDGGYGELVWSLNGDENGTTTNPVIEVSYNIRIVETVGSSFTYDRFGDQIEDEEDAA
jgi:hypothetical protein